jgi:cell division protease FtsH
MAKNILLWVVIAIVLMSVFNNFTTAPTTPRTLTYSDFIEQVRQGEVKEVTIQGRTIEGSVVPGSGSRPSARATTDSSATS